MEVYKRAEVRRLTSFERFTCEREKEIEREREREREHCT